VQQCIGGESGTDALSVSLANRVAYFRAKDNRSADSICGQIRKEAQEDLKLRRPGRLLKPATDGLGAPASSRPFNRWLPLPADLYPGLGEGTRFAQILYVSPGENVSRDAWETGWRKVVGRAVAGVDPGVRTLYTLYDPQRCAYVRLGYGWSNYMDRSVYRNIRRVQAALDNLQRDLQALGSVGAEAVDQKNEKKAQILERELEMGRWRAQARVESDRMDEIAFCVMRTYPVLILPAYGSKSGSRQSRRISRSVTRRQAYHSFYDMRERLKRHHALLGWIVDLGTEAFSTQCCPGCGEQNPTVGGGKFHQCRRKASADRPACPRWDRDCGSARSITVRHLRKYLPELAAAVAASSSVAHVSPEAVTAGSSSAIRKCKCAFPSCCVLICCSNDVVWQSCKCCWLSAIKGVLIFCVLCVFRSLRLFCPTTRASNETL
jgi:hypothetical protein